MGHDTTNRSPDPGADPEEKPGPGPAPDVEVKSGPAPSGSLLEVPAAPVDIDTLSRVSSGPPYSTFSRKQRILVTVMTVLATFVSPMTANIYFPALPTIAADLGVSISLINLTLTTCIVLQGIAPMFFGDFGDMAGRRPAYTVAFLIYLAACIGLAIQRDYAALMVLRAVQSTGSSGTLALGYATIADITTSAERGRYMGYVGAAMNVGPTLGPVLGGILSQYLGWPAIFWFCAIYVAVWLVPWLLFTPETCRTVVGNGTVPPQRWNEPLIHHWTHRHLDKNRHLTPQRKLRFPNPLKTLKVIWEKEMGLILLIATFVYMPFLITSATLATLFKDIYGYSDIEAALCYLPYGIGCCIAAVGQGYALDWNYGRVAKKVGMTVDLRRGDDLTNFPIESARIQPLYPALVLGASALIGYGWALDQETSVAVPLVMLLFIGICIPPSWNVLNTLIVDLNADAPATAAAASNFVRCIFGVAATSVVDYMMNGIGRGWSFTLFALMMTAWLPVLRLLEKRGPRWRREKAERKLAAGT